MPVTTFTEQELSDWRKYERVRLSGCYNMLFPQARKATKLSEDRYHFVLANYDALRTAALAKVKK